MLAPSHVICGLGAVVALMHGTGLGPSPGELLLVILGSLAPDIDGDGSITRPGRLFLPFIGRYIARLVDVITRIVGALAKKIAGHRGLFHWPIIPVLMLALAYQVQSPFLGWFAFGYFTHIVCDTLTKQGIPWLAPISYKPYSFGLMRTGSLKEFFVAVAVLLPTLYFGFDILPTTVKNGAQQLYARYVALHHRR